MNRTTVILVAIVTCLCLTDSALAWGPATHVGLGSAALSELMTLPAAIAAILSRHRLAYLYGNIAADMVFAKRLSRVKQFCHHWSTGFSLLECAHTPRNQAFAYGYLSHLAADTVAHSKFIPRQLMLSGAPVNIGHFYWEIRADAAANEADWQLFKETLAIDNAAHFQILEPHMTDTFLTHKLNIKLFAGVNALAMRKSLRSSLRTWNRYSSFPLEPSLVKRYRLECLDRMLSVLKEGHRSAVLKEDPNGTSALMRVHVLRRELNKRKKQGLPNGHRRFDSTRVYAPAPIIHGEQQSNLNSPATRTLVPKDEYPHRVHSSSSPDQQHPIDPEAR